MKKPCVSILTTVYNREKYLSACINSVLNSTYSNWELIIVDDGSTDNSVQIAHQFAKKDDRIKVFINEKNLGDYPNRNRAAKLAKGEFIKYLDADDMIYPHGLEIMVNTLEKYPDAAMGVSQYVAEDYKPYPFEISPREIYRREFIGRGVLGMGPTATIIRKKIFDILGGFTGKRYVGDIELWLKIGARYPIVKIQDGLIFWRRHEEQEIGYGLNTNAYLINNYLLNISALNSISCPLSNFEQINAIHKVKKRHARNLLHLAFKRYKYKQTFQVLKETNFTLSNVFRYVF